MSVGARCTVARLSQNAMSPSFHLKRTVYSGRVMCSHRISRIFWLSRGVSPTIDLRNDGLTYRMRSLVSACTVTIGCSLSSARRFTRSWYSSLRFGKARHLARYGAKACGMAGEVDARAVGEEIIKRGAAATALQPVNAAEPIIVEDDDVELLI